MNERVTLVLNTRQMGRENSGDLREFLQSIRTSAEIPSRAEVIFKLDNDDSEAWKLMEDLKLEFSDIDIKYFSSPRYGYQGLFIGYAETKQFISSNSVAVLPVADDMPFVGKTEWDKSCVDKYKKFPDGIFMLLMAPLGQFTDGIFFSKKIVDLVGFGPTFAVDQWGFALSKAMMDVGLSDRLETITACGGRRGCALDFPTNPKGLERWNGPRQHAMDIIGSVYFKEQVKDAILKIQKYLDKG